MNPWSSWLLCQFKSTSSSNTYRLERLTIRYGLTRLKLFLNIFLAPRIRHYSTVQKQLEESVQETNEPSLSPEERSERARLRSISIHNRHRPAKQWNVLAGVLLSRPPLLVPEKHLFEEQLVRYQEMLEQHHYTQFPIISSTRKAQLEKRDGCCSIHRNPGSLDQVF